MSSTNYNDFPTRTRIQSSDKMFQMRRKETLKWKYKGLWLSLSLFLTCSWAQTHAKYVNSDRQIHRHIIQKVHTSESASNAKFITEMEMVREMKETNEVFLMSHLFSLKLMCCILHHSGYISNEMLCRCHCRRCTMCMDVCVDEFVVALYFCLAVSIGKIYYCCRIKWI